MSEKRKIAPSVKKQVAGKQRFTCAANVAGYECPLSGKPFDEAGYIIDHILPLSMGGSNDKSNLQALCLMCHRVKISRASKKQTLKEEPTNQKVEEVPKPKIAWM